MSVEIRSEVRGVSSRIRGVSFKNPWSFIQESVEFHQRIRGVSSKNPWSFIKESVEFHQRIRGVPHGSPWIIYTN
jgi:hypothetical protein